VISAISGVLPCAGSARRLALLFEVVGQVLEHVVEHRVDRLGVVGDPVLVFLDGRLDALGALGEQLFFALLVPGALVGQVVAQAEQRFLLPGRVDFALGTVAARVVGRGVVATGGRSSSR
jgi:hypothetical protein